MSDSQKREINILLDNASQRCFLKSDIALEMNLPVKRQETLAVYTFGSREPIRKTYDVVQLTLCNSHDPDKKITIEALLTDFISGSNFRVSHSKLQQVLENKNIQLSNVNESVGNELDQVFPNGGPRCLFLRPVKPSGKIICSLKLDALI